MVEVPAATGVITPVNAFIVAMAVSDDDHVPPEDPFEVNVVVPLEHIACVPLIVPAFGGVVIVIPTGVLSLSRLFKFCDT